ncbi:hypothetical protein B0I35DRAFT_474722 [Stachybotrys elegans]|uniref:DNA/RNA-binding protein Alba-like domain-containing protein n=1 Tax=Stachybotrys elegans TaxID=80388 RepID=A0A8K0SVL6_9HYPO|nr:hypothetical protein B0I35DRAFT_474722 [Stachybotrys elegans]
MAADARADHGTKKRKTGEAAPAQGPKSAKKHRVTQPQPSSSLVEPHEAVLAQLAPHYDALPVSVISSTPIGKRTAYVTRHLLATADKPRVALLYARTTDVCKLITVVEQCKRVLGEEGKSWYQYNQLFTSQSEAKKRDVIEETVLERNSQDSHGDGDGDGFETMGSRFERAVAPRPPTHVCKSMRVFLAVGPVPELKAKDDITLQSSDETKP